MCPFPISGQDPIRSRPVAALALVFAVLVTVRSEAQSFAGTVSIERQPADRGTLVRIAVFRADRSYTFCGETTVGGGGSFTLQVTSKPACRAAGDTYEFYVNGVWASSKANPFSPGATLARLNLSVPMLALRTQDQGRVRLVWFYGKVADRFGRSAPPGMDVLATPRQQLGPADPCTGRGKTEDLFWTPKAPNAQPVTVKGFYWIAIEASPECQDRLIQFCVVALTEGCPIGAAFSQVRTPPYALPNHVDLVVTMP